MRQYNNSIRGKLFKYFQERLGIKRSTKGWWRCDCFYCGHHHTMGIHLENYKAKCFACDFHDTPVKLLMDIESFVTQAEAWAFLKIQQEYDAYERINRVEKRELIQIELPESFTLLIQGSSLMAKAARRYMEGRGFDCTKLSLMGVGYCKEGEYGGYIIFPFYRKGKLVYFQGRRYMGAGPKMKNPPEELYGIGKSELIFNEDALFIYKRVYMLESITNSLTIGDPTIGISGKTMSPKQFAKILMSPCEEVIILLDRDARKQAYEIAMQLVHHKMVKVIEMPSDDDVNKMGKKQTMELVKRTPFQNYMDLLKGKIKLNETGPFNTFNRIGPHQSARGF